MLSAADSKLEICWPEKESELKQNGFYHFTAGTTQPELSSISNIQKLPAAAGRAGACPEPAKLLMNICQETNPT